MSLTPTLAELLVDSVIEADNEYEALGRAVRLRLKNLPHCDLSTTELLSTLLDHLDAPLPDTEVGVALTCLIGQASVANALLEVADAPIS